MSLKLRAALGVGSQVWVLIVRNMRFYMRNPELLLAKLFTYIFMGGFMGARPVLPVSPSPSRSLVYMVFSQGLNADLYNKARRVG